MDPPRHHAHRHPQDDDFDDDLDFDDLPPNTLDTLEQHARLFSASQLPPVASHARQFHPPPSALAPQNRRPAPAKTSINKPPSSDYGFDDEDVIDLDAQPAPAAVDGLSSRGQWRQHDYGTHSAPVPRAATTESGEGQLLDVDALKARVLELEHDRAALQKSADDAKAAALAKAGEISIVRANRDKASRDFEARIDALQKLHVEEAAKAKAELDSARREREKVETSNKFLEHDLAQEAEKARNLKKSLKDGNVATTAHPSPFSTPRKNKALTFRDGFDDDEILFVSPSKARDRSKPGTPRAGAKRKRAQADKNPNDSPRLSFLEQSPGDDGPTDLPHNSPKPALPASTHQVDHSSEKFELMQRVLNHRSDPDRDRSLEILTKFSLPSAKERSLSSIIYDSLALKTFNQDFDHYRLKLCDSVMSLWSQCLAESYYAPLYDLNELLQYILTISPSSLSTTLISRLVPLCQASADLVAVPMAKASKGNSTGPGPSVSLQGHIDPLNHLNTLHLMAINCETPGDLRAFWSTMEFDFVLLMLHKAQPIDQVIEMLELLFTSILDDTFGAIAASPPPSQGASAATTTEMTTTRPAKQQKMENDILDRLTVLLFEIPQQQNRPPEFPLGDNVGEQHSQDDLHSEPAPHTPASLLPLRTTVLTLLHTLARTAHGSRALAAHRLAIPRLARFLHESLLQLYAYFPSAAHAATAACVNTTVLLLAHLDAAANTDSAHHSGNGAAAAAGGVVRAKLAAVPGGLQRWLVSLSRVAFAEGVGAIEAGLLPEVREVAHRVLDEMLSPEEGEGVLAVFL